MPRLVAHRIGINFSRADAIEEAVRKRAGNQQAGAGVMGVKNGAAAI